MSEADLVNLFIESSMALDNNFEFWLTASFAMLIASYLVTERIPFVVFLITMCLYLLSTVLFMIRGMAMGRTLTSIRDQLTAIDAETAVVGSGENLMVAGLYFVIMVPGTVATIAFVYWRYRRLKNQAKA